jgi:YbbR domain-containing protein
MKHLKTLFGLAIIVSAFYMAFLLIPIYYNNYSFQDELDNQARMVSYSPNTTVEQVQDVLAKKAKELEIPLTPEQIHVQISGADITISAQYSVNVHTPIKDFVLTFEPTTKNHRI